MGPKVCCCVEQHGEQISFLGASRESVRLTLFNMVILVNKNKVSPCIHKAGKMSKQVRLITEIAQPHLGVSSQ